MNGKETKATLKKLSHSAALFHLLVENRSYQLAIEDRGKEYLVRLNSRSFYVKLENERARQLRRFIKADEQVSKEFEIKAPMPGLIVKINVHAGQEVKKGDSLFIIEAMKMENEIRATADGKIKKILKSEKMSVEKNMVLMVME